MSPSHRLINLQGTRIHTVEQGEGPLVILIHGFPESWYSWRHQLPALAQAGYRAVAIDQRGYGQSSKFPDVDAYRIDRLSADVINLIDHYGEQQAVVVGHDWGAPVAWTTAWLHPDRVRGVAGLSVPFSGRSLVALPGNPWGATRPGEYYKTFTGDDRIFYQTHFGARQDIITEIEADLRHWMLGLIYTVSGEAVAAAAAAGQIPEDPLQALRDGPLCLPPGGRLMDAFVWPDTLPGWLTEDDLDFFVGEFQRSGFAGPLAFYNQVDAGWAYLEPHADQPLAVPSVFIGGEMDVATHWGVDALAQVHDYCRDHRGSHIVSGSGHWIQQECPEETNRLLLAFLDELQG
jgi:pimeloyl-ACP methyl ester carboxylesterase